MAKRIYLAGPFFNVEQLTLIQKLETELRRIGWEVYSPREDGILMNMTPAERVASSKKVFARNVEKMLWADIILAVIDNFDPGTVWELGFCYASGEHGMVTYTDHNFGLNVMLQESVDAHVRGMEQMTTLFSDYSNRNLANYRNFAKEHVT